MRGLFALVLISADDPEQDRRRPQRPADRRRPRRRRVLRRLRHPGDPQPHARRRLPRRRGDGGHHARRASSSPTSSGRAGLEGDAARARGIRSWRRRPATSTSCSRRSSSSRRRSRETILGRVVGRDAARCSSRRSRFPTQALRGGRARHDPRLRHVVARGAGRQVPDRDARARAGRGRLRLRVPLPRSDRRRSNTLAVVITQSGETADTLAALREAKKQGRRAASRSATSSAAWRRARPTAPSTRTPGPEIGVASTKAFTSQLVALYLLALYLGQVRGTLSPEASKPHIDALLQLPLLLEQTLKLRAADRGDRRAVLQRAPTSSTSAAASTTRSRSKAR